MDNKILDFTIVFTWRCNLSCSYCKLLHLDNDISYELLDEYIIFLKDNINQFKNNWYHWINFLLFWWEPLLIFDKIKYFIENIKNIDLILNFKIYTNWLSLNKEYIDYLYKNSQYIDLYISIDWDDRSMLTNRFKTNNNLKLFSSNITNIKDAWLKFIISKVLYEVDKDELFNNLIHLLKLQPKYVYIYLASYWYMDRKYNQKEIENIFKWLYKFIHYLLINKYNKEDVIRFLWFENILNNNLDNFYDVWLILDLDGNIYWALETISIFSINEKFNINEKKQTLLWNLFTDKDVILKILWNLDKKFDDIEKDLESYYNRNYPYDKYNNKILNNIILKIFSKIW